jgi:hypothetical protein
VKTQPLEFKLQLVPPVVVKNRNALEAACAEQIPLNRRQSRSSIRAEDEPNANAVIGEPTA